MKEVQEAAAQKAAKKRRRKKGKGADAPDPDPVPVLQIKTLEDEPKLSPHLFWVWQAFTDLNYRRVGGMGGPQPISFCEIEAYCRLKAIYAPGDRERLLHLLDPLDREWMAKAHEEAAKKDKTTTPPPPPSHSPPRGGGTKSPPRREIA